MSALAADCLFPEGHCSWSADSVCVLCFSASCGYTPYLLYVVLRSCVHAVACCIQLSALQTLPYACLPPHAMPCCAGLPQVSVLEEISRGEILLAAAGRCLKLMKDFVSTQLVLADPAAAAAAGQAAAVPGVPKPHELGFEMVCALLNNSVDCYNQSLEFTEHVQVSGVVRCCCAIKQHSADGVEESPAGSVACCHMYRRCAVVCLRCSKKLLAFGQCPYAVSCFDTAIWEDLRPF